MTKGKEHNLSLRMASVDDLEKIEAIEKSIYGVPGGVLASQRPWTLNQMKEELSKPYSQLFVLTDDETDQVVAGYVFTREWELNLEILNFAINLEFRGMGLGQKILRHLVSLGIKKDFKRLILEVRKSNKPAWSLYQKIGFTVTHVRKNFYSDGEDAFSMCLNLEEDGIRF